MIDRVRYLLASAGTEASEQDIEIIAADPHPEAICHVLAELPKISHASVMASFDFLRSMRKVETMTGTSQEDLDAIKDGILNMARETKEQEV